MKQVVLISGRQGSGKSTTSQRVRESLWAAGRQAQHFKFAGALYEMHTAIRAILTRYGVDELKTVDGPLLQLLGTEWGRKTRSDDIWVRCLLSSVQDYWLANPYGIVIIDDCRFENEFRAFTACNDVEVVQVRLVAPRETRKLRAEKWRENESHPSEAGLDGIDDSYFDIVADTSLESTSSIAGRILSELVRAKAARPTVTA